MDFNNILIAIENESKNPFALKINGEWEEGTISVDYLNRNFSQYKTADEMINATESAGLKLYFDWLKEKGILN